MKPFFCCVPVLVMLVSSVLILVPAFAADGDNQGKLIWGAGGHNDRADFDRTYSYHQVSIAEQMKLLREAGLSGFRSGCLPTNCDTLIDEAAKNKITYLRPISLYPDARVNEQENYDRAYRYAYSEAQRYAGRLKFYEASNELDNWVSMKGHGDTREQYNSDRYVRARGHIRGLIEGVHAGDPTAKVLVNDAGWCHYGFLKMLWEDGVRWDITAVHWYASMGNIEHVGCGFVNVAAIHASFGKPIWITELNSNVAASSDDPQAAGKWITDFMTQINGIAKKYNFQAGFIYELLDEKGLRGGEAHYGLADLTGQPKTSYYDVARKLKATPPQPWLSK